MLEHSHETNNAPTASQVVLATVSATIALAALAGWAFNVDTLTQIIPGSIAMNPATCVAVLAVSIGVVCRSQRQKQAVWVLASIAITIGITKFSQYLLGASVGVDQLLFADQLGRVTGAPPNRMAPNTAVALVFLGWGLLWSGSRNPRRIGASQILCVTSAAIASVAAVGYALDVVALYQIQNFIAMALPTTIVLILLSIAVISINPTVGIARISSDRGPAGLLARFALPFAVLVPLTIGVAVLTGQQSGWYGADFATSLSLIANVVVNIVLLGGCTVMLFQSDTERKLREASIAQSESEYREAEKVGHIGYWKVDTSTRKVQWSDGFLKICGLPAETVPSIDAIVGVCHPDDAPIARAFIEQFECGNWEFACRIQRPDGELRHIRSHGVCLNAERGSATVLGVFSDITELELARQAAEKAKVTTASFLANMSHEIRTPMNGVMGFVELLLRGDLNETQRRHLGLVQDSAQALLKLLNDILDISKIESGRLEISSAAYDVRHGIVQCARLMTPMAEQKGIRLEFSVSEDLPQELSIDGLRLRQVLLNLIGNAVKFTNKGSVKVEAGKSSGRGGADLLQITVSDTGIGIPSDRLESVFETFVQAEGSTAQWFGGSGLGLSISRSLAEMMGGAIRVESVVGEGTTMTLVLPWVEVEGERLTVSENLSADALLPAAFSAAGASILLVEDVDINRELFREMLNQLGHRLDLAENGARACELARRLHHDPNAWDLILMDLQMPVMDGLTATRTIRAYGGRAAEIPIIALTASAFEEEVSECLAAGMDDHIAKPVDIAALRNVIDRWHGRPQPASRAVEEFPGSQPMHAKFAARCDETFERLTKILAELSARNPQHCAERVAEARDAAHFLAGCAGMFGQPALGDLASNVERKLEAALGQLPARLAVARRALQTLVTELEAMRAARHKPSRRRA